MSKHGDWLRATAKEMRGVGASTMTPHELLAFYACEIEKTANSIDRAAMLSVGKLRETAGKLDRIADVSTPWIHAKLTPMLREAADTIDSLRDRLQEAERHNSINLEVMGEMYNPEIIELMQECHATRANYGHCKYSTNRGWRDTSRYSELFGTPERAARTLHSFCEDCLCGDCATCGVPDWADYSHDYDALIEWLKGKSDG